MQGKKKKHDESDDFESNSILVLGRERESAKMMMNLGKGAYETERTVIEGKREEVSVFACLFV